MKHKFESKLRFDYNLAFWFSVPYRFGTRIWYRGLNVELDIEFSSFSFQKCFEGYKASNSARG